MALKLLATTREDARLRFAQEGALLAGLGGSHHLIGSRGLLAEPPGLVLELAEQGSLRDRLEAGPLPLRVAVLVARQAAEALDWLHRHRVYHRDVKPSNLLFAADGTLRLADLGVAAAGDPPRGLPEGWIEEDVGTLGYAAPELLRAPATATPQVDVYGLAAVLYESLTGALPVPLEPDEDLAAYRARAAAGPLPIPPVGLAEPLRATLLRALSPDPSIRFATARAFAAHL